MVKMKKTKYDYCDNCDHRSTGYCKFCKKGECPNCDPCDCKNKVIKMSMTLHKLLEEHPEWANIPIAIYENSGDLHYVGASGDVYEDEDENGKILVFSGN